MYKKITSAVQIDNNHATEFFPRNTGLQQVCILSRPSFIISELLVNGVAKGKVFIR